MDDLATSEGDSASALRMATEVTSLVSRGGFRLRKWTSNSKEMLAGMPVEESTAGAADLTAPLPTESVLGVTWDPDGTSWVPVPP